MTKNMTPKKRKAVAALLACPDITTAALKVGVSRETMYRIPVKVIEHAGPFPPSMEGVYLTYQGQTLEQEAE